MTDHSDLIERLRAAIDLGDRTGSRGKRPENIYNVADEALTALSSQSLGEAAAYDFVAGWHERQAKLFREMADDEPRTADAARKRAAEAATHHAASAAALRNRAAYDRRAALVSGSREDGDG